MIKRQPGFLRGVEPQVQGDEASTAEVAVNPSIDRPTDRPIVNQCAAHRKNGDRCRKPSIRGATVCLAHGGGAPQVRRKAQVRLAMAADDLMRQLLKIALSSDDEGMRYRATVSALDRAGIGPKAELEVSHELKPFEQILQNLPTFSRIDRTRVDVNPEESARLDRESASETQGGDVVDVEFTEDPPERPGVPFHQDGVSDVEVAANRSDPSWRGPTRRRPGGGASEMEPGGMPLMTYEEAYGGGPARRPASSNAYPGVAQHPSKQTRRG